MTGRRAACCPREILTALVTLAIALAAAPAATAGTFTVTTPAGVTYSATDDHLEHWIDVAMRVGGDRREARTQAFQLLLSYAWIRGEADERGIVVSDAAVSGELERQMRQSFESRAAFRKFLRDSGQTVADIQFRLRVDLTSTIIREQVTAAAAATVTDAVVDAHHAEHGNIPIPERRDLRLVRTRSRADAVAAKRTLLAGAGWAAVARRYSIGAGTDAGARLPNVTSEAIPPALAARVFRAPPRRIIGPVKTRFGYFVARVTRVHPGGEMSPARSRTIYRDSLIAEAQTEAMDRFVQEYRAKWKSRTVCAPRFTRHPECVPDGWG